MSIESISGIPVNRSVSAKSVSKDTIETVPTSGAGSSAGDSVAITPASQDIQSAISAAGNLPVVDEEKVAAFKSLIQSGQYQINSQRIAAKMLQFDGTLPNST